MGIDNRQWGGVEKDMTSTPKPYRRKAIAGMLEMRDWLFDRGFIQEAATAENLVHELRELYALEDTEKREARFRWVRLCFGRA